MSRGEVRRIADAVLEGVAKCHAGRTPAPGRYWPPDSGEGTAEDQPGGARSVQRRVWGWATAHSCDARVETGELGRLRTRGNEAVCCGRGATAEWSSPPPNAALEQALVGGGSGPGRARGFAFAHRRPVRCAWDGGTANRTEAGHAEASRLTLRAIIVSEVVAGEVLTDLRLQALVERALAFPLLPGLDSAPREQLRLHGLPDATLGTLRQLLETDSDSGHMDEGGRLGQREPTC